MQAEPLISVIVPVYNVAPYLGQCIDSLIRQTYKRLEIILIDDGSTDNSRAICDEYALLDERISVIYQENSGQSVARNQGLALARGEYISFVDSDDWVEADLYEDMVHYLQRQAVDVLKFRPIKKAKHQRDRQKGKPRLLHEDEALTAYRSGDINAVVWDGIYRRDFIRGLQFERGYYCEDVHFTLQILCRRGLRLGLCSGRYYHYRQGHASSTMSSKGSRLISDLITLWQPILKEHCGASKLKLPSNERQQADLLLSIYQETLLSLEKSLLTAYKRNGLTLEEFQLRRSYLISAWHKLYQDYAPLPSRGFRLWLYHHSPSLYWLARKPLDYIQSKNLLVYMQLYAQSSQ